MTLPVSSPKTVASLKRSEIPPASEMRAAGKGLPVPKAVLDVHALGKNGVPEFAWRVDEGTWSTFVAAPNGELVVEHPVFLLQGMHRIEVRSRVEEDPHGISEAVPVGFMIDWEPPELTLTADRPTDRLVLTARDVVSPADKLEYAYQVGDGTMSPFEAKGGLPVHVRDQAGNVAEAKWRAPVDAIRPGDEPVAPLPDGTKAGCTAATGLLPFGLLAVAGALRRRKR
jgi:uncharacterized protein (TIGR03382 family)